MPKNVLIIEDDNNIADLLRLYLERDGFVVKIAADGRAGINAFESDVFDIVLLDIMLPVVDGWSVLRELRTLGKTPVIMLTAKGQTTDKIQGLEMGADDYVTKPFEMKELLARVHAVLRRTSPYEGKEKKLVFDGLTIDMEAYTLTVNGVAVDAPPKELELIYHLASSPNRVYTRNQLLDEVWGFNYFGDSRTVDVHIKRLRAKLEGISEAWSLKTVWGVGYKFELAAE